MAQSLWISVGVDRAGWLVSTIRAEMMQRLKRHVNSAKPQATAGHPG